MVVAKMGGPLLNATIPPDMAYSDSGWVFGSVVTFGRGIKLPTIVATDTLTLDTTHCVVVCNKGSAMTVNLPAASSSCGLVYFIKNKGAGVVTVDGNGSDVIDSAATATLNQWQSINIISDGIIWVIV